MTVSTKPLPPLDRPKSAQPVATDRVAALLLTPVVEDLGRLYPWLDEAAAEAGVPARLLPRMHVALEEAVANVAFHGFGPDATGQIAVRLSMDEAAVRLVIEDNGAAFDPTTAALSARPTSLAEATPGGWGLGLIRRFCPDAAYERRGQINQLTLSFPLAG